MIASSKRSLLYALISLSFILIALQKKKFEISSASRNLKISVLNYASPTIKESLEAVPEWMQYYVKWHAHQRQYNLHNPETKFLTVTCYKDGDCGGISDRLKPIPFILLFANKTERVLFIKWEKFDFDLTFFLRPPPGGLDWTFPLDLNLEDDGKPDIQNEKFERLFKDPEYYHELYINSLGEKKNLIIYDHRDVYREFNHFFKTETRPIGTFRDIMNILFEPTAPIQQMISHTMKQLNLVPFEYNSVHYRSGDVTYKQNFASKGDGLSSSVDMIDEETRDMIHNSINCAVHAARGDDKYFPIYFTSSNTRHVSYVLRDSPFVNHPKVKIVGIDDVVRLHSDHPVVHYEKERQDPRDLYQAFVDLWILGMSNCVSYGRLGYGLFGARLAGEECMIKHHRNKDCPSLV